MTKLWIIRCGFFTCGQGVVPEEELRIEESWGPFYFSPKAAESEVEHLQCLHPESSFVIEEISADEISHYHTEHPELWELALQNNK